MRHSLGMIESTLIWLAGHTPRHLRRDAPSHRAPLARLGATVLFATLIAGLNWAVAGWTYSAALADDLRLWLACAAGLMGAALVLVFDRGLIFVLDTQAPGTTAGRLRLLVFSVFRVGLVLTIGGITSQALIPLLMPGELNTHALSLREDAQRQRLQELHARFDTTALGAAAQRAEQEVTRLTHAAQNLPPDITRALAAARQCWSQYNTARRRLTDQGISLGDARQRLRANASACQTAQSNAQADEKRYRDTTRRDLDQASVTRRNAVQSQQHALDDIARRASAAEAIEDGAIHAHSSAVLWSLLASNPGALGKWLMITVLLMGCELLPLVYKLQLGQSLPGLRIATAHHLRRRQLEVGAQQSANALALQEDLLQMARAGTQAAMTSPEVRDVFQSCFAGTLKALAPSKAVLDMMRDLEANGHDIVQFQRRHPQYAAVIAEAWRQALARTTAILGETPQAAHARP